MNFLELLQKCPMIFSHPKVTEDMSGIDEELTEHEFQSLMANSVGSETMTVEVVYITSDKQIILETQVPRGSNIEDGIVSSGLLEQCNDVDLEKNKVGLLGMIKPLTEKLSDGDRIEIYRPVTAKE